VRRTVLWQTDDRGGARSAGERALRDHAYAAQVLDLLRTVSRAATPPTYGARHGRPLAIAGRLAGATAVIEPDHEQPLRVVIRHPETPRGEAPEEAFADANGAASFVRTCSSTLCDAGRLERGAPRSAVGSGRCAGRARRRAGGLTLTTNMTSGRRALLIAVPRFDMRLVLAKRIRHCLRRQAVCATAFAPVTLAP
jgi:hypothetical protein